MHKVKTFQYQSHEFRSIQDGDNPLFVAKDVCEALELGNVSEACNKLPDDEKGIREIDTPGGEQTMLCVTESGLYRLIFRSNKPEAEKFRRWVFHEVLPAIRKTGSYTIPEVQADRTVDIRHFRNPKSPSGLDIRYNLDLTKIILGPKKRSLQLLQRLTGVDLSDLVDEEALVELSTCDALVHRFVSEWCVDVGVDKYVPLATLHKAYLRWYRSEDLPSGKVLSNKGLSACLVALGYEKGKRGGTTHFYGIGVKQEVTA